MPATINCKAQLAMFCVLESVIVSRLLKCYIRAERLIFPWGLLGPSVSVSPSPKKFSKARRASVQIVVGLAPRARFCAPLLEESPVCVEQTALRVVDVRRFRGDAVEFDDLEARTLSEIFDRGHAYVEAPEVEAFEPAAQFVNDVLKLDGLNPRAVEEDRAAAVRPQFHEPHPLALARHIIESLPVQAEVRARHADRALVLQYQRLKHAHAVAHDHGEALLRDGEDSPALLFGEAAVEDSELEARRVLLNDRVAARARKVLSQLSV